MTSSADPLAPLWARTRELFARTLLELGMPSALAQRGELTRKLRRRIASLISLLETIVRKLLLAEAAKLHETERRRAASLRPDVRVVHIPVNTNAFRAMALRRAELAEPPERRRTWTAGALAGAVSQRASAARAESPHAGAGANAPRTLDLDNSHAWPARFSLAPPRNPRLIPSHRAPRILATWDDRPPVPIFTPPAPPPPPRAAPDPLLNLARRFEAVRRVLANPAPHAKRMLKLMLRLQRSDPNAGRRIATSVAHPGIVDAVDPRLPIDAAGEAYVGSEMLADADTS